LQAATKWYQVAQTQLGRSQFPVSSCPDWQRLNFCASCEMLWNKCNSNNNTSNSNNNSLAKIWKEVN